MAIKDTIFQIKKKLKYYWTKKKIFSKPTSF